MIKYFIFRYGKAYHLTEKGAYTFCGLACDRIGVFSKRPSFRRLCKRCAKWLPRKATSDA